MLLLAHLPTLKHTRMKSTFPDVEKSTHEGTTPCKRPTTITGSISIDRTIIGLCPEIIDLPQEQIIQIATIIQSYIFGEFWIKETIESIINDSVIDFIGGLKIIAEEKSIKDIAGIEANIISLEQRFKSDIICPKDIA